MDVSVQGANELEQIARRLKDAGATGLRKELLKSIRVAAKPMVADVKANALVSLPRRGGLAAKVAASSIGVRTRTAGKDPGVRIVGKHSYSLRLLNAGKLRHPVWGHTDRWVAQSITPGFFNEPIEKNKPELQRSILRAMADVANKVERGI